MTPEMRKKISDALLANTDMTREQYIQTCLLAEELDLEISELEENVQDILSKL